jgi:hypothetical protein
MDAAFTSLELAASPRPAAAGIVETGVSIHGVAGLGPKPVAGQAPFGRVRVLCGAVPARFPLLPGVMRVGRRADRAPGTHGPARDPKP